MEHSFEQAQLSEENFHNNENNISDEQRIGRIRRLTPQEEAALLKKK